ncbi:DEAD/DEAH box helicase [Caldimonas manganoxidans]|uniref:DEAD/DEAH box helicase n=1 Tax=Caldimonas manganoxidans TaxID=196015 RepID=UPI000382A305|nr:AAA domain-containing protein [Caldimonas manganoxidans]
MSTPSTTTTKSTLPLDARAALRFWHQIEFFIPFDLQQVLDVPDAEWSVRCLSRADLRGHRDLWRIPLPSGLRLMGFDLYLGLFDKSRLAETTRAALRKAPDPDSPQAWEQDERGELEGPTCMAKLRVGPTGEPLLDEVCVSLAPWALGRLQTGGLEALDTAAFDDGMRNLKDRLWQFRAEGMAAGAKPPQAAIDEPLALDRRPLSGQEVLALLEMFEDWSGLRLDDEKQPVVLIRAKSVVDADSGKVASLPAQTASSSAAAVAEAADNEDEDAAAGTEDGIEIDILNSFYVQDIARALAWLQSGGTGSALVAYLSPLPESERLDLYSDEGRKHILETLIPNRLPRAHWPDEPAHAMSLMQQFAVNSIFERLGNGGIFSVNGPPGTGKTTLLRDVFAEIITWRARALAQFNKASDALGKTIQVEFHGEQPCKVRPLHESLVGFEMVVASSNNAAVENISRDLPKAKALGKATWRHPDGTPRISYLRPVACNLAARTAKGDYAALAPDDEPWGLLACALGKKANRTAFADRLRFDGQSADRMPTGYDPERHQSLWRWRQTYSGPSFTEARQAFLNAANAVEERLQKLDRFAKLSLDLRGQTRDSFVAELQAQVQAAQHQLHMAQQWAREAEESHTLAQRQLSLLREEERLIERQRPAWWLRWWRRAQERQYRQALAGNHEQQRHWLSQLRALEVERDQAKRASHQAQASFSNARQRLEKKLQEWDRLQAEWQQLKEDFPAAARPDSPADLEQARWQIEGLWRDETLNRLRSELFVAALGLHEAWLAEVLQKGGGFGGNVMAIGHLLAGKRLTDPQQALAIWQSLFMIVPVVSSTFASIARQFRDLGPGALGWLFIDEAGQAVPQAAVGALWRARRAVVVGDPLQIEPVFTVPIPLIEALAGQAQLPDEPRIEPHLASVQTVADAANAHGTWLAGNDPAQWIGSPLRVHRRCADPMFTIANAIAYGNKMVFGLKDRKPPAGSLDVGPSSWVAVGGRTQDKLVVPEQVALIGHAIQALIERTGALPDLYVITPFRRIKSTLITHLNGQIERPKPISKTALRQWCQSRIGTVHTFQGKEESLVFLVLGCDDQTRGAANWAASKPNLLNVALTRAKHRIFIIGDPLLWAGLPHFAEANERLLPRIDAEAFLARLRSGSSSTTTMIRVAG